MRVLIVADSALAAGTIHRALRHCSALNVLGFIKARNLASYPFDRDAADLVVLDELPAPGAVATVAREIRAAAPRAHVVLLTVDMDRDELTAAFGAGVDAAVCKNLEPQRVAMLVRDVAAGNVVCAGSPTGQAEPSPVLDQLTARELEILQRMAAGASNSRIAGELWVTEQTVKFHLSNVYRKLNVSNRTQASHVAHLHGLVHQPGRGFGRESFPAAAPAAA